MESLLVSSSKKRFNTCGNLKNFVVFREIYF